MNLFVNFIFEQWQSIIGIFFLAMGISLSGILLHKDYVRFFPFLLSFLGIFAFLSLYRFMEEIKNVGKNRIINPKSIFVKETDKLKGVNKEINFFMWILLVYSFLLLVFLQPTAALLYVFVTYYLWLIYKNFYLDKKIARHLFLKGILYQAAAFPIVFFAVSVGSPSEILSASTFSFGLVLFGAALTYEICRVLNPHAHPVLTTYVQYFGFRRAFEYVAVSLALSAMGASFLELDWLLLPVELTVLFTLAILFFKAESYLIPELAVRISLFVHGWSLVIKNIL